MPDPAVLPRWQNDYEDRKKEFGPGGSRGGGGGQGKGKQQWPWRLVLLAATALFVAGYFLTGGSGGGFMSSSKSLGRSRTREDKDVGDLADLEDSETRRGEEDSEETPSSHKDGQILSPKPAKAKGNNRKGKDALRKQWEAEKAARKAKAREGNNKKKKSKSKKPTSAKHKASDDNEEGEEDGEAPPRDDQGMKGKGGGEEGDEVEANDDHRPPMKKPSFSLPDAQDIVNDYNGINAMRKDKVQRAKQKILEEDAARRAQQQASKGPSPPPPPPRAPNTQHQMPIYEIHDPPLLKKSDSASGPPYLGTDYPALTSKFGCHTKYCDQGNLTYARTMILHAWKSYMKYAKGSDDLYPMQRAPRNWYGSASLLNTPIDSLDTLWLSGLREEYDEARALVDNFNPNAGVVVSFFETTIRQLGGLLSAYALTGESDEGLLDKATALAERLSGAFTSNGGGLPMGQVNLQDGHGSPLGWMGGGLGLAEVGTFQMEFAYLGHAKGGNEGREFIKKVEHANNALEKLREQLPIKGLYPFKIMPSFDNPTWANDGTYKVGGGVDSFYEYLLKQWIMLNREPTHLRDMFDEAALAIIKYLGQNKTVDGRVITYFPEGRPDAPGSWLEHLACFIGGTFALGARTWEPSEDMGASEIEEKKKQMEEVYQWGKGFTETCVMSYRDQETGIGPEAIEFNGVPLKPTSSSYGHQYLLRPETIESVFYMWRLTHDQKWRDMAWDMMRSIQRYCATPNGYAGLTDVSKGKGAPSKEDAEKLADPEKLDFVDAGLQHVDLQESFFIAETLKYFMLIFADDELLPLDQWVFNTEAHPMPVHSQMGKKRKKKVIKEE